MSRIRFGLEAERQSFLVRRGLGLLFMGALLFVGSLVAMRLSPKRALAFFGATGALLMVLALRRLLLGTRPLVITDRSVWVGRRAWPVGHIDAVEIHGKRVTLQYGKRSDTSEELADPVGAAETIAGRAGLHRVPGARSSRWERSPTHLP